MSQRIPAKIGCPYCNNTFDYTLFRSIWGEYPENRDLVISDQINVATCPACNKATKLKFAFIYTNADKQFAVWWEPEFDDQIDKDAEQYVKMLGAGNYLATAPRIKDWQEFKNTILKFERGELKGKPGTMSDDAKKQMEERFKHVLSKNSTPKSKSGCFGVLILFTVLSSSLLYFMYHFL